MSVRGHTNIAGFRTASLAALGGVVLFAGCMSLPSSSHSAWHTLDPQAPLGAQPPVQVQRLPSVTTGPADSTPPAELPSQPRDTARIQPEAGTTPLPRFPALKLDEASPAAELELTVDAPRRKQVGSQATYRVTIRNSSDHPVSNVSVECRFDEPLEFTGSDKHRVVQRFEQLLPGEVKELALSLLSNEIGAHCCRFAVSTGEGDSAGAGAGARAEKSVCVEFVSRQLQIDLLGPARRTEGSRAEFTFTLTNHSARTLTDVKALLSYDQALVPREASAGRETRPGNLTWDLGTLQPMESIQLQVDFECRSLARRACVALEVQSAQVSSEQEEACVEIIPVAGTLDLRLTDRDDPLELGKSGLYEVTVHNIGLQPAREIALEATIPPQLKVVSAKVRQGDTELRTASRQEAGRLIFEAVGELAADDRLIYLIEVEAIGSGAAELRVRLTSSLTSVPVTTAEPTMIAEP
jgi:hypothetical protein